jgi:hypothetical protein
MKDAAGLGPKTTNAMLPQETHDYLARLISLGILEGAVGDMKPTPEVRRVLEALHIVAAGGAVRIDVVRPANPDLFGELEFRMARGMADANTINAKADSYLVSV